MPESPFLLQAHEVPLKSPVCGNENILNMFWYTEIAKPSRIGEGVVRYCMYIQCACVCVCVCMCVFNSQSAKRVHHETRF